MEAIIIIVTFEDYTQSNKPVKLRFFSRSYEVFLQWFGIHWKWATIKNDYKTRKEYLTFIIHGECTFTIRSNCIICYYIVGHDSGKKSITIGKIIICF